MSPSRHRHNGRRPCSWWQAHDRQLSRSSTLKPSWATPGLVLQPLLCLSSSRSSDTTGRSSPQPTAKYPVHPAQLTPSSLRSRVDTSTWQTAANLRPSQQIVLNCFDALEETQALSNHLYCAQGLVPSLPARMTRDENQTKDLTRSLKKTSVELSTILRNHKDDSLTDLVSSSNARCTYVAPRVQGGVGNNQHVETFLKTQAREANLQRPGSLARTYTGHGAADRGMAKRLFNASTRFHKSILAAEHFFNIYGFFRLLTTIKATNSRAAHIGRILRQDKSRSIQ
ncbi:hypothetical protein CCHL11_09621 [Colletotrichum chlorophyti]|uniref:Uncharacterized protein n=1 Tax=Colletotrichum chlorophyti TaxID=708187 RepID=A0A1Q8S887_9PEZI|nr:hypothetical protein CCHL11_09621 [Colletotrichum chlorophyti]